MYPETFGFEDIRMNNKTNLRWFSFEVFGNVLSFSIFLSSISQYFFILVLCICMNFNITVFTKILTTEARANLCMQHLGFQHADL